MLNNLKDLKVFGNILEIIPLKVFGIEVCFKFHILKIMYFKILYLVSISSPCLLIKVQASRNKIGNIVGRNCCF